MSENGETADVDSLQMMGIVNALKTGNMQLDMLIAMCIPVLLRFMFSNFEYIKNLVFNNPFWCKWKKDKIKFHERFLESSLILETGGYYGSTLTTLDNDTQNSILIKAIKLFVNNKCNLQLDSANLDLTSMADIQYQSDDECEDYDDGPNTLVRILNQYKLLKRPLNNEWHCVGLFGQEDTMHIVEMRILESQGALGGTDAGKERMTILIHLRSECAASIDMFVENAYSWYLDELRKQEKNFRYHYELQKSNPVDKGGEAIYMRYKLSDEKTFDSLFFRQKETLLSLVKHFTKKTGKYSIKGYPHKMGLLLHGPPGTGKTSMIKALAEYTGRSIVNVPLSKVETNSELQSIFFDHHYHINGEWVPVKLDFKDVIFVLEDVDAASDVVKRRDGKKTADVVQVESLDLPPAKSIWRMLIESNDGCCQDLVARLIEKSERLRDEATKPQVVRSLAARMSVLPGLSLVGSHDDRLSRIGNDALEMACTATNGRVMIDSFLNMHVRPLLLLLDQGTEIDESLVDELLSIPGSDLVRLKEREVAFAEREVSSFAIEGAVNINDSESSSYQVPSFKSKEWAAAFDLLQKDKLNLTGLLNVLDGVVDTPGRMLIMTTNHPELLDPALIRPGRIDKKILLGYMGAIDIISMLEHYFQQELSEAQRLNVVSIINGDSESFRPQLNLTPAQVEQMAAEHDDFESMICALEEKGRSRIAREPGQSSGRTSSKIAYDV